MPPIQLAVGPLRQRVATATMTCSQFDFFFLQVCWQIYKVGSRSVCAFFACLNCLPVVQSLMIMIFFIFEKFHLVRQTYCFRSNLEIWPGSTMTLKMWYAFNIFLNISWHTVDLNISYSNSRVWTSDAAQTAQQSFSSVLVNKPADNACLSGQHALDLRRRIQQRCGTHYNVSYPIEDQVCEGNFITQKWTDKTQTDKMLRFICDLSWFRPVLLIGLDTNSGMLISVFLDSHSLWCWLGIFSWRFSRG